MKKNLILAIVLVIIVGAIILLQSTKQKTSSSSSISSIVSAKAAKYPSAVDFVSPSGFINSEPFSLKDVVGKQVILVDFWTYSCINCQRTQPYLNAWEKAYGDKGLLIVGVHTPEFSFEHDINNVRAAVADENITYPVVLDNDYGTWDAYKNLYWPHKYLIDIDGYIVYDHIGEGGYDETEAAIQKALAERDARLGLNDTLSAPVTDSVSTENTSFSQIQTNEVYFGDQTTRGQCGNCNDRVLETQTNYTIPSSLIQGAFYLGGSWLAQDESMQAVSNATVALSYSAKNVYGVLGSEKDGTVSVYRDGVLVNTVAVQAQTLYTLINGKDYGAHNITLSVSPGVNLYTYTFG